METKTSVGTKPSDSASSREIAQGGNPLFDLLTNSELGARVKGFALVVEEPRRFEGSNERGKYVSCSRRLQLFAGQNAGSVIIRERQESLEHFRPISIGEMINTEILGCDMEGKQMVFRVKL